MSSVGTCKRASRFQPTVALKWEEAFVMDRQRGHPNGGQHVPRSRATMWWVSGAGGRGAGVGCKLGEAFGGGCDHTVGKNKARSGGDVSPGDAFSMYNIKKEFRCR